jgi:hypothetical protein
VAENLNEMHLTGSIVQGINELLEQVDVGGMEATREVDTLQMGMGMSSAEMAQGLSVSHGLEELGLGLGFDEVFAKEIGGANLDFWEPVGY